MCRREPLVHAGFDRFTIDHSVRTRSVNGRFAACGTLNLPLTIDAAASVVD
jgi:hypothetical protein